LTLRIMRDEAVIEIAKIRIAARERVIRTVLIAGDLPDACAW